MEIEIKQVVISVALAFLLSGISQVMRDLGGRPIDRPLWATRPTLGKVLLVVATWFTRPFVGTFYATGQKARAFAYGLLEVFVHMTVLTSFIWSCISFAAYIFDSTTFQFVGTAVFIVIGGWFVIPLLSLIMIPVSIIVAIPLDFLFPLRETSRDFVKNESLISKSDSDEDEDEDEDEGVRSEEQYYLDIEAFLKKHGYDQRYLEAQGSDTEYHFASMEYCKSGYDNNRDPVVVAALIMESLVRYEDNKDLGVVYLMLLKSRLDNPDSE